MKTLYYTLTVHLALLASLALPAYGGFIIPTAQWGAGQGYAEGIVPNVSQQAGTCYVGYSAGNPSCAVNTYSNQPTTQQNPYTGTDYAALTAFVDASGAHLTAAGDGSGSSASEVQGDVGFGDVEINNSSSAEQFQLTFHLDAELYSKGSSADQINLTYYDGGANGTIFTQSLSYGGAGTYLFVDQDITTPFATVAPHSSLSWFIDLGAILATSTDPATVYPSGLPEAFIDAGNTLSITQFSVFDASGNPLPQSALTSTDGYDYSSNASAPEPASGVLFVSAGILLVLAGRFRRRLQ